MADYSDYTDDELMAIAGESQKPEQFADYSDEELMAIAGEAPQEGPTFTEALRAAPLTVAKGATFGLMDEAQAAMAAPFISLGKSVMGESTSIPEAYAQGLEIARRQQGALEEYSSLTATGLEIGGAIGGAVAATPAAVTRGLANVAARGFVPSAATASGVGAASGGLYGFGTGEGGARERLQQTGMGAGFGALGGIAGASLGALGSRALNAIKRRRGVPPVPQQPLQRAAETTQELAEGMPLERGRAVDLTKGQMTQDPAQQIIETSALKGGVGQEAQDLALAAQAQQQGQIRGALQQLGSEAEEAVPLEAAAKTAKQAYKSIRAKVNKAYDNARITQGVYINKSPINETFKPQVNAIMRTGNFDLRDFSTGARQVIEDITNNPAFKDDKITGFNLAKMERWRGRATNLANDAYGTSEGRALKEVVNAYDDFMAKLPEHALMSGDDEALQAIQKARGLRKRQGVLFERDKVVRNIVQNKELTNEELANLILTGKAGAEKVGAGAGRSVKNLIRAVPEDVRPQFKENIKRGVMSRVLNKSQGATIVEGQLRIEPNKLLKEVNNLARNKTFMNEVFDDAEKDLITALSSDLRKINSVQAGADNYSNTAYALMRFFNNLPLGGLGAGPASKFLLEPIAEKGARKTLEKNISPVLHELRKELSGTPRFYGATVGGVAPATLLDEE